MITPRRTRLVRVPDLQAFRRVIRLLAAAHSADTGALPLFEADGPAGAIVVPTRGAAIEIEPALDTSLALVTREELYDLLHARLANPPRRLTPFERDTLAQAAAAEAVEALPPPGLSFRLRPGLVVEILRFYDQLRRQSQSVKRFEELLVDALSAGVESGDRGADRMRRQTDFLARAFRAYERRVDESGGCDEHSLRSALVSSPAASPLRSLVVTVTDWIADPNGLFVADFDLLSRLPGLESIDIVATEAVLRSGFHERLREWWPEIEEADAADVAGDVSWRAPVLLTPSEPEGRLWFTYRDREEELVAAIGRMPEEAATRESARVLSRTAIVFKRPLPYLYLASRTLGSAAISFRASDTLPLAAEPAAAAVDLVLDAVESDFSRTAIVALLRCPSFRFAELNPASVGALDAVLSDARYLGDPARLDSLRSACRVEAREALGAAIDVVAELLPLVAPAPASLQSSRLLAFVEAHLRPLDDADPLASRDRRARAAIAGILTSLSAAHLAYHDPQWTLKDLGTAVRRWIEQATFAASSGGEGVHLLDDQAARYGEFDDMTIVGLVQNEWPERPRPNIFYPPRLLKSLGWPSEKDRRAASGAHLLDLLGSASRRVAVSTFTLDDEALVTPSTQLDDLADAHLVSVVAESGSASPRLLDDVLTGEDAAAARLPPAAAEWLEMRVGRSPASAGQYHGSSDPVPARAWSVSALETYLDCPFKFFARYVLALAEEPDDEEVMDPRREGRLVHDVFERFFRRWQESGRRGITPANIGDARALFQAVVEDAVGEVPGAEAGLARTRLLGSPAAAGLGEAVFRMEAARPTPVVERLLEFRLKGEFDIGGRVVPLSGVADRLDLLDDGTFRLIDYKLGWPPAKTRALQLPIYSLCAEQRLSDHNGRRYVLGEAAYLAFKGPKRVVPLFSTPAERTQVLVNAQERLAETVAAIERGVFPPRPVDVYRCETCPFTAVCRTDYV